MIAFTDEMPANQLLGAVVLHDGLVMHIGVVRRADERRVEGVFLDLHVHRQCLADLARKFGLAVVAAGFLERISFSQTRSEM